MKKIQKLATAALLGGFLGVANAAAQEPVLNDKEKSAVSVMAAFNRCVADEDKQHSKRVEQILAPHRAHLRGIEESLQKQAHVFTVAFVNGDKDRVERAALREGYSKENAGRLIALLPQDKPSSDEEITALSHSLYSFLKSITPIPPGPPLPYRESEDICKAQLQDKGIDLEGARDIVIILIEKHGAQSIRKLIDPRP